MTVIDSHLHLFKVNSKDYPRPVHPGLADEDREVLAKELIIQNADGHAGQWRDYREKP